MLGAFEDVADTVKCLRGMVGTHDALTTVFKQISRKSGPQTKIILVAKSYVLSVWKTAKHKNKNLKVSKMNHWN